MDIFHLDTMTEMIRSPLLFLSYVSRRTSYADKLYAYHETVILSYFIKHNPWLEDNEYRYFDDSIKSDVDVAMMVRRLNIPGNMVLEGAFAELIKGHLGKILEIIQQSEDSVMIELGFLISTLNLERISEIEGALDVMLKRGMKDQGSDDISIFFDNQKTGMTIHFTKMTDNMAKESLFCHCGIRKYIKKAASWYGLCFYSNFSELRFIMKSEYPWVQSNEMDAFLLRDKL